MSEQDLGKEVLAYATPSRTEDGFVAAEKRAEHWLNLWANFWSPKRGWL